MANRHYERVSEGGVRLDEVLSVEKDQATSEQLSNAWRVVGKRLLTEGYDPALSPRRC